MVKVEKADEVLWSAASKSVAFPKSCLLQPIVAHAITMERIKHKNRFPICASGKVHSYSVCTIKKYMMGGIVFYQKSYI